MNSFHDVIDQLNDESGRQALKGMRRGIEREALRVEANGNIAGDSHPQSLGSALTNARITTDYSESLLEFITPVHQQIDSLLRDLTQTHAFTVRNIGQQQLWPISMPGSIDNAADIAIADYGSSNIGQLKRLYRNGLTYRYGAQMQIISGVHFNFSVSDKLWQHLYEKTNNTQNYDDFISSSYFGLIRNYRRLVWVLPYLFGASPAFCSSFIQGQSTNINFEKLGKGSLYLPYATSLRMSDLGYTNKDQERLNISYNSLAEYIQGVNAAINMPSKRFEDIGVKVDGRYRQLNANILQIENELYSPIRAKRMTIEGEKPSQALARAGVEYIEVRALDVNPFSPIGIDANQVRFLDLFLLYCLLSPSPKIDAVDEQEISHNLNATIIEGRKPKLMLRRQGSQISMRQWLHCLFEDLQVLAQLLDMDGDDSAYQQALNHWEKAIDDPSQTLSGLVLSQLLSNQLGHSDWALSLAQRHSQRLKDYPLSADIERAYKEAAKESLQEQTQLETDSDLNFEQYLMHYLGKNTQPIEGVG